MSGNMADETLLVGLQWKNDLASLNREIEAAKKTLAESSGKEAEFSLKLNQESLKKVADDLQKVSKNFKDLQLDRSSVKAFNELIRGLQALSTTKTSGVTAQLDAVQKMTKSASAAIEKLNKLQTQSGDASSKATKSALSIDLSQLQQLSNEIVSAISGITEETKRLVSELNVGKKILTDAKKRTTGNKQDVDALKLEAAAEKARAERAKAEADIKGAEAKAKKAEADIKAANNKWYEESKREERLLQDKERPSELSSKNIDNLETQIKKLNTAAKKANSQAVIDQIDQAGDDLIDLQRIINHLDWANDAAVQSAVQQYRSLRDAILDAKSAVKKDAMSGRASASTDYTGAAGDWDSALALAQSATGKTSAYGKALSQLATQAQAAKISDTATVTKTEFEAATKALQNFLKELDKLNKSDKYNLVNKQGAFFDLDNINNFSSDVRKAAANYGEIIADTETWTDNNRKWNATVKDQAGNLIKLSAVLDQSGSGFRILGTHVSAVENDLHKFGNAFKDTMQNFIRFDLGQEVFQGLRRAVQEGWQEIQKLDAAMTELDKVSDASTISLREFRDLSFDIADGAATTGVAIQNSAADWVRLGYEIEHAGELAKNTAIYATVGDMDIDTATEHMISSVKAFESDFNDTVTASREIADIYNEVGNRYAIDAAGIGSAMERSAAALVAANNDIYESVAMVTAGNEIAQDPELVGNTLKVISMRVRGATSELAAMGEETDGVVESTAKLQDKILGLTGVDIMDGADSFKSTYQILDELSRVWDKMSDIQQAEALEVLAGKQRGSTVSAMLQNFDQARAALETAQNASGSAARENAAFAESIQGHLNKLTNSWQEMWANAANRDTINFFIDFLDLLTTLTDKAGALNVAIGAIFGSVAAKSGVGRGTLFSLPS